MMIYLDNASTTRPLVEVRERYISRLEEEYGNPSSPHAFGKKSARSLEKTKERLLSLLGIPKSHRAIFLSGATEANNMAIRGIARQNANRGKKLITSKAEHPSVLNTFKALEKEGYEVIYLPLSPIGAVDPKELEKALDEKTILVSLMGVNNETGAISPVKEYAGVVHRYPKCVYHADLTQDIGKLPCEYDCLDLFSFSAHKFGGLKGNGALVIKKGIYVPPLLTGGEQEYGLRAGTEDVLGAIAMVEALEIALKNLPFNYAKVHKMNAHLRDLLSECDEYLINSPIEASPYVLNFSLKRKKASVAVEALSERGIYVGTVSACSSKGEPLSQVLLEMGLGEERARNSVRVSFSEENTLEEVDEFYKALEDIRKGLVDR